MRACHPWLQTRPPEPREDAFPSLQPSVSEICCGSLGSSTPSHLCPLSVCPSVRPRGPQTLGVPGHHCLAVCSLDLVSDRLGLEVPRSSGRCGRASQRHPGLSAAGAPSELGLGPEGARASEPSPHLRRHWLLQVWATAQNRGRLCRCDPPGWERVCGEAAWLRAG